MRGLTREIDQLRQLEVKAKNSIQQAAKRADKTPSQKTQAIFEAKTFAKELIRIRRQRTRISSSKAQLESVQMQINEAFTIRKIQGSMKVSTDIMKSVNSLVKLPELMGTMQEISQELMKAGIIEEMISDTLDTQDILDNEDEEVDAEVDKVLGEVLNNKMDQTAATPAHIPAGPVTASAETEEEEEDTEEVLAAMRGRLEALRG